MRLDLPPVERPSEPPASYDLFHSCHSSPSPPMGLVRPHLSYQGSYLLPHSVGISSRHNAKALRLQIRLRDGKKEIETNRTSLNCWDGEHCVSYRTRITGRLPWSRRLAGPPLH